MWTSSEFTVTMIQLEPLFSSSSSQTKQSNLQIGGSLLFHSVWLSLVECRQQSLWTAYTVCLERYYKSTSVTPWRVVGVLLATIPPISPSPSLVFSLLLLHLFSTFFPFHCIETATLSQLGGYIHITVALIRSFFSAPQTLFSTHLFTSGTTLGHIITAVRDAQTTYSGN